MKGAGKLGDSLYRVFVQTQPFLDDGRALP